MDLLRRFVRADSRVEIGRRVRHADDDRRCRRRDARLQPVSASRSTAATTRASSTPDAACRPRRAGAHGSVTWHHSLGLVLQLREQRQRLHRRELVDVEVAQASVHGSSSAGRLEQAELPLRSRRRRRSATAGRRATARRVRGRSGSRARARRPPAAARRAAPPGCRSCGRSVPARPCAGTRCRPSTRGRRRGSWRRRAARRRDRSARDSASRKSSSAAPAAFDARCSATAQARLRPSNVDVPRPISSRMTRLREVAQCRMFAVSCISTMNVDWPRAMLSDAPTRANSRSTTGSLAVRAGTNEPACAIRQSSARLPQVGGLAAHVRAGQDDQLVRRAVERDVVGHERVGGMALDDRRGARRSATSSSPACISGLV